MTRTKWTDRERVMVTDLLREGYSYAAVSKIISEDGIIRTSNSIRHQVRRGHIILPTEDRLRAVHTSVSQVPDVYFADKRSEERRFNWREWTPAIQSMQKLKKAAGWSQTEATVKIKTDRPVIIQFLSDLHLGSYGVNYDAFKALTDYILSTPNLYVMLLGDEVDFFHKNFPSAEAIFSQVMSPEEQVMFFESWLEEIKDKGLCITWGNHSEAWAEKIGFGISFLKDIKAKIAPYFNGIGKARIFVNDIEYIFVLSHFFKGFSMYNPLHGVFNAARMVTDGDIFAQGHIHEPAIGKIYIRGKQTTGLRCGSIKVDDNYGRRYFTPHTLKVDYPSVVLNHEYKDANPFFDGESALQSVAGVFPFISNK